MGRTRRGVRDSTGPYRGSYIRRKGGKIGRRRRAGQPCPKKKRKK